MPKYYHGVNERRCDDGYPPCCGLVLLYARLGLHRYNLLQGKNLQLIRVKKYNKTFGGCVISTFYITLEVEDPAIPASLLTFQARVTELGYRRLLLKCGIARPLGETKKKSALKKKPLFGDMYGDKSRSELMPDFPSENPFENTNRFYVLDKTELQAHDWIQLYLDLAVATTNRSLEQDRYAPTNLKILKVSIETTQDPETPNQGHDVYDATFYIRYKDSCQARVGKDVDRIAVIRRILDKNTGDLRLLGRNESSLSIIPKKAKKSRFRPLLGVHKPWRLSSLRLRKSYKNPGVGFARRHKTKSI
ncbi:hypothetical protein AALP_AA1G005600 [Arabis alpina]|uniref:Uncharacterized protein n=1 Tax=Arabis alpina TaxID=50452 RepID=A0A087HK72_ARAAL|nr:hypothetical protein AALP_AA1G005600 [Arabis alpina]